MRARDERALARARFDGMTWPKPGDLMNDLGWRLRYGKPSQTDLYNAASIVSAYQHLVNTTERNRRYLVRGIKSHD